MQGCRRYRDRQHQLGSPTGGCLYRQFPFATISEQKPIISGREACIINIFKYSAVFFSLSRDSNDNLLFRAWLAAPPEYFSITGVELCNFGEMIARLIQF